MSFVIAGSDFNDDLYVIGINFDHEYSSWVPDNAAGIVKIGRSVNCDDRLTALQAGSPVKLKILYKERCAGYLEPAIHKLLGFRRLHGEWFDLSVTDPVTAIRALIPILRKTQDSQTVLRECWLKEYLGVNMEIKPIYSRAEPSLYTPGGKSGPAFSWTTVIPVRTNNSLRRRP